jgi:hypothetical protein
MPVSESTINFLGDSQLLATCAIAVGQHKLLAQSVKIGRQQTTDDLGRLIHDRYQAEVKSLVGQASVLEPLLQQWGNVLNAKDSKLVFEFKTQTDGYRMELHNLVLTSVGMSVKTDDMMVCESLSFIGTTVGVSHIDPNAPAVLSVEEMQALIPSCFT